MKVRYKESVEPVYTDGRDIDTAVARLIGEAADQKSEGSADVHLERIAGTRYKTPSFDIDDPTYYDVPMLKESVWSWAIPVYYYVGGLTGASLALGAALLLFKRKRAKRAIRLCHIVGLVGSVVSGVLLVYDLGQPWRFLNMLRVFRPTSPMNLGAWILSSVGGLSFGSLILGTGEGVRGQLGTALSYGAGFAGLGLATYTGVLVANTAVPVWQESRKSLPALFGASAMSSVGCFFDMVDTDAPIRRITGVFGTVGRVAEIGAAIAMKREASAVPRVARPLEHGFSGFLWKAATVLTAASLAISLSPVKTKRRLVSGVLGTLGSLMMRFAVERAGIASSRDPRASFHQQRMGRGAEEVTKSLSNSRKLAEAHVS